MSQLPIRGLIAPVCIALSMVWSFINIFIIHGQPWIGLLFLGLGLIFARDTRALFTKSMAAVGEK